ncbi:T9SS type A sorting domain-containing protein, partial [bacterium]|nr:T9SS type A sorting domain-containing protein [bacterium]
MLKFRFVPKYIVLLIILSSIAFAWEYANNLGGGLDEGRAISMCADGGFFLTGRSNAWALGGFADNWYDYEMFLVKLDGMGTEEWVLHYGQLGEGYYDAAWCVYGTPDSGAILCGKTQSPKWVDVPYGYTTYYDDILVVRVDKNGDTLWTHGYGGNRFDRAWWIKGIPGTGDFFMTGPCASFGPDMPSEDYENIWIMRIDSLGEVVEETYWADTSRQGHTDVRWGDVTSDGGCIVVGATDMRDTSYYYAPYDSTVTHRISRIVLIKVDSLCNIEWEKIYDLGCADHYPRGITSCVDDGFLMTCYNKWPAWTLGIRLDENGDTLWTKYIGLDPFDPSIRLANFNMVINDADNGFYFAGSGQGWGWLVRTDAYLNEMWTVTANFGSQSEVFLNCVLTPDGGCCGFGYTYSLPPSAYSDIYAMRVNRFGYDYTGIDEVATEKPSIIGLKTSPNPFNSSVSIEVTGAEDMSNQAPKVEIFNISGRLMDQLTQYGPQKINSKSGHEEDSENIPYKFTWEPKNNIPSGTYLLRAKIGNIIATK